MLALGCLIPLVLLVAGTAAGWAIGGQHAAVFGAVAGGIIGMLAIIGLLWGWSRIRNRGL